MDMYEKSLKMFLDENKVEREYASCFETSNLRSDDGEIDERDLDRAELLCSLGQTVMISNFRDITRSLNIFQTTPKQEWD
jgi:hypothetical protein